MTRQTAIYLRECIEKGAEAVLTDEEALDAIVLFPMWKSDGEYVKDDRVRYAGKLYKCLQSHNAQPDWTPDVAVALWVDIAYPGTIPVWRQPQGAHDAYNRGDKVYYPDRNGLIYDSLIDANVYVPTNSDYWDIVL